jgi:glycosyltransferase involved in cell wall biosynthesis
VAQLEYLDEICTQNLISVIIPVYNIAEYLPRCTDSILNQSGQGIGKFEIFLINDGSTDESGMICDKLAQTDARINVIHQKNKGPGGARNTGINSANGEYIMFVDGDDFLLPKALENVSQILKRDKPDVLSGRCLIWRPETGLSRQSLAPSWNIWRYVVRRKMLAEHEVFFKANNLCEDVPWIVEMLKAADTKAYLAEPFYAYYLYRPESTVNSQSAKRIIDTNTNICELIEKYREDTELAESLLWQSFLGISEYHSFKDAEKNEILESYQQILPLYKSSASPLYKAAGMCSKESAFRTLSWLLSKAKKVRRAYKYGD